MTIRARPLRRKPRSHQADEARRQLLVTVAFVAVVILAILILVAYAAVTYYNDHLVAVARVGSATISKDDLRYRVAVDRYRLSLAESQVRDAMANGNLSQQLGQQQLQQLAQQDQQLLRDPRPALEELIDDRLQAQLAPQLGASVSQADVDAEMKNQATTDETRHVLLIAIDPMHPKPAATPTPAPSATPAPSGSPAATPAPGSTASPAATATPSAAPTASPSPAPGGSPTPQTGPTSSPAPTPTEATPEQLAAAKAAAQEALAQLKAGKDFAAVANEFSTDFSAGSGGDLGFVTLRAMPDEVFGKAVFALAKGATTEAVEGADKVFRIGRVSDVRPQTFNDHLVQDIQAAGADLNAYRDAVTGGLLRDAMTKKLVATLTGGPVEQVHAYEILLRGEPNDPSANMLEVKASHVLYSPNDDPQAAANLADTDPAWAKAEQEAKDAADKLQALSDIAFRKAQFADTARTVSDDKGSGASGGDLGWFSRATMVKAFGDAVFEGEHKDGDIIGPVRTQFGWHVILYEGKRQGPRDRLSAIKAEAERPGADFATIARRESEGVDASSGGDMGWIARYQREKKVEDLLFGLAAGTVSDIISDSDGLRIYYVKERQQRTVDADQRRTLQGSAFDNWYAPRKGSGDIWRDPAFAGLQSNV